MSMICFGVFTLGDWLPAKHVFFFTTIQGGGCSVASAVVHHFKSRRDARSQLPPAKIWCACVPSRLFPQGWHPRQTPARRPSRVSFFLFGPSAIAAALTDELIDSTDSTASTDCTDTLSHAPPPFCLALELHRLHGWPPSFTTASTKKRKIAPSQDPSDAARDESLGSLTQSPDEGGGSLKSPRSSPLLPPSAIPPHMHDEVFEATTTHDSASSPRDYSPSSASSPSAAYANLSLESSEFIMAEDSENTPHLAAQANAPPARPPPRASSPAKRPHSDMDDVWKESMDVDTPVAPARRSSGQSSPRATKPLPTASQRSLRATSIDMLDAPTTGGSVASSETASVSNGDSAATSLSTATESPARSSLNLPDLDDQVSKVMVLSDKPLTEGQEGYIISEKWLERVFARTSENVNKPEQFEKSAVLGEIGPIDNSSLVDTASLADDLSDQNGEDFIPLKPGLTMTHDFEILPTEAWELIVSWYGIKEGSPVIRRYVHNTALDDFTENLQYEVYPPIFTIRRVRRSGTAAPISQDSSKRGPKIVASRSHGYVEFLKAAKKAASIELSTQVRVWRVLNSSVTIDQAPPQQSGMLTPESSPRIGSPAASPRHQSPPLNIDASAFTSLAEGTERELVTGKDETTNEKYNGSMNLQLAGLGEDQVLILEEQDEKGEFVSESSRKIITKNGQSGNNEKTGLKAKKGLQSNTSSGRNSPALSGPMTRGRTRTGRTRGTTGLTNLGNTCYMNSALQCIRSVEELSIYFLEGNFKKDLNSDNPLGHGGNIAKTYAGLLNSIYSEDSVSSFTPKNFKNALGRAQPMFSGYGQQDSQEFLSFLVDGLHEDLNRIKKKPYTENPESDDKTVHDPEAIKALGEKFREIHKSRNDSVAMDLFNGFYKNTMVCPDCNKVSVTFDPYSLLTLQLPIEQTWQHTIKFVPLRGQMYELEVDIDKNRTIKQLKEYVGKRFGNVKPGRLMGAEVYSHKFYRVLDNDKSIAECNIGQRDDIWFFELSDVPTNWPAPKKKQQYKSMLFPSASSEEDIPKSASPLGEKLVVPIFHRAPNMSTYRAQQWSLVLWPSYIVLDREEAKDYDSILKKVLAKVAQMTTRPILTELSGTSLGQSCSGSDLVLTTEEDASPNGDVRVHDGSVEGEDNLVEVTMTEPAAETPVDKPSGKEPILEILKPGSFVPAEFRALFEIKHTRPGKEMVPTGWSTVDHNKAYDLVSKRIRIPPSRESSVQSFGEASNASSSEETDDNPQFSADAQSSIELATQSSDEEMQSVESTSFVRGGRGKKQSKKARRHEKKLNKYKNAKTYSKKGKDRFAEQSSNTFSDNESEDDEGLIRLGEAIVLEWAADAYDALFDGTSSHDSRGMDTLKGIEHLVDEELQAKKALRAARKKNGITLEECFAETSKSEILSEDNAWYCSRCKDLRRATKTLEIWTVPDILVVHLKRFSAHRTFRDKIEALVDFPIEGLDLSGKVGLPDNKELLYDLFAVDNHYGGLGGGHYTAYAQNFFDKQWYEYNDSSVMKRNNPNSVVTTSAYLLFYRRRSAGPLGPPYIQNIVNGTMNQDSENEDGNEGSISRNPSHSPAGNGLRLDDSSRNGSSSAGAAGAVALHGGGLASAENLVQKGAAVGTADDEVDGLPPYDDEGYGEGDTNANFNIDGAYSSMDYEPVWSFSNVGHAASNDGDDDVFDDDASNAPNMGSRGGDDLHDRLLEDFGDDIVGQDGMVPGMSTPLEEEPVVDVRLDDDGVGGAHGKLD